MSLSSTASERGLEGVANGMVLVQGEEDFVYSEDVSYSTSHVCMSRRCSVRTLKISEGSHIVP